MDITKLSIKRPVALSMVILIILILGGVSLSRLPIDLMPSMDIPMAIIYTSYPQAGSLHYLERRWLLLYLPWKL